jgi:hypothetical protein
MVMKVFEQKSNKTVSVRTIVSEALLIVHRLPARRRKRNTKSEHR